MPAFGPHSNGIRSLSIGTRTLHLLGMALLTGGLAAGATPRGLETGLLLTGVSGVLLLLLETTHGRHWPFQLRGLVTLSHLAAVALLTLLGHPALGACAALVLGALGSHMPKQLRKWSLLHRGPVD